jgi:hypothetical protein
MAPKQTLNNKRDEKTDDAVKSDDVVNLNMSASSNSSSDTVIPLTPS